MWNWSGLKTCGITTGTKVTNRRSHAQIKRLRSIHLSRRLRNYQLAFRSPESRLVGDALEHRTRQLWKFLEQAVPLKKEIRLAIWTRADSISQRKPASLSLSGEAENNTLAIRLRKQIGLPKLRRVHRRLPSTGYAKLNTMRLMEASRRIAATKFNGNKSPGSQRYDVSYPDVHCGANPGSCDNN